MCLSTPGFKRNFLLPEHLLKRHSTTHHPFQSCHSPASVCQDLVLRHCTNCPQHSQIYRTPCHLSAFSQLTQFSQCTSHFAPLSIPTAPFISFSGSITHSKIQEPKVGRVFRKDENHGQKLIFELPFKNQYYPYIVCSLFQPHCFQIMHSQVSALITTWVNSLSFFLLVFQEEIKILLSFVKCSEIYSENTLFKRKVFTLDTNIFIQSQKKGSEIGSNNDPEVLNSYSVRNDRARPGTSGWKRSDFRGI